jgi:hypothetical protein
MQIWEDFLLEFDEPTFVGNKFFFIWNVIYNCILNDFWIWEDFQEASVCKSLVQLSESKEIIFIYYIDKFILDWFLIKGPIIYTWEQIYYSNWKLFNISW